MFVLFNRNTTSTTGGAGKLLALPEHMSSHPLLCGCFTFIGADIKETKMWNWNCVPYENTSGFLGVPIPQSLVFCVVFCRSLFDLFPLFIVFSVLRFMPSSFTFIE